MTAGDILIPAHPKSSETRGRARDTARAFPLGLFPCPGPSGAVWPARFSGSSLRFVPFRDAPQFRLRPKKNLHGLRRPFQCLAEKIPMSGSREIAQRTESFRSHQGRWPEELPRGMVRTPPLGGTAAHNRQARAGSDCPWSCDWGLLARGLWFGPEAGLLPGAPAPVAPAY